MSTLFAKAKANQCRWFVDAPAGRAGSWVCAEPVAFNSSYCQCHRTRVYQPEQRSIRPGVDMSVRRVREPRDRTPDLLEMMQ